MEFSFFLCYKICLPDSNKIITVRQNLSLYFREHELHESNPCGVLSLLIAYELHEYHPDGKIRGIRL